MLLFATMAVRDGGGSVRGMNGKGKTVKLPPLKPGPAPTAKVGKPKNQTEADKAATAKANKNPQFTGKNVPVKQAGKGFAGSSGTYASGFKNITKGDILNATLAVTSMPGSGQVRAAVAKTIGKKVGQLADTSAFKAASKGLASATGAGGKVTRTVTPFGPTLRSTRIGSSAQQAARVENLLKNADRIAAQTARGAAQAAIRSTVKVFGKASEVGRGSATIYVGAKTQPKKKKK